MIYSWVFSSHGTENRLTESASWPSASRSLTRKSGTDGRVAVDLPWTAIPSYFAVSLDPKSFWERLEPIDLLDTAGSLAAGGRAAVSVPPWL